MSDRVAAASWLRFLAVTVALVICAVAQWNIYRHERWDLASQAVVIAAVAAAVLLGKPGDDRHTTLTSAPSALPVRRTGLVIAAIGVGIFSWAAYVLSTAWQESFGTGALVMIAGVAIWCGGLAFAERKAATVNSVPLQRWELVAFLLILAVGFALRFYRCGDFPPPGGFCAVEEPQSGQAAYNILAANWRPWEFVGDRWMGVLGFKLYGVNVIGLRLPFMFVSAITIIPFFFLVRELVSRPAALLATLMFAACRWHLIYARLAHNIFPTTFVVVLLLCLCVRVHKRGGLALYPLIGFLSAYTLYTYAGYRGTSLFVGLFFLISFIFHVQSWRRASGQEDRAAARRILRQQLLGFGMAALAAGGLLIVLYSQLRTNPTFFFEAMVRATDDSTYYTKDTALMVAQRKARIRETLMMFNHLGDDSGTFNLPGTPMLDPVSGGLLTVAVMYCVLWGRYRWQGFFAAMFLVLLVMGTIFVHNFDIRRLQGIIPLIFVLIAFLADRVGQLLSSRLGSAARPLTVLLWVATAGLAFADNFNVYVVRMMNDITVRRTYMNAYSLPIRYLHTLPDNGYMLFVADQLNFFMPSDYEWWRGDRVPGTTTSDLTPILTGQPGPWTGRQLYILIANPFEHDDLVRLLKARFPTAECGEMRDVDIAPHFRFAWCKMPSPAQPMPITSGVHARYYRGDSAVPIVDRIEPAIAFGLLPDACRFPAALDKPPCRAEWEGTWEVKDAGTYVLSPEVRNGDVSLTVDDQPVRGAVQLTAGPHLVRMKAKFRTIEEAGAHLTLNDPATNRHDLVMFTQLAPDVAAPAAPAAP